MAASRSPMFAAVTATPRSRPRQSVTMCRFRPQISFPPSKPREAAGTVAAAFPDCASMIPAVGSASRPRAPAPGHATGRGTPRLDRSRTSGGRRHRPGPSRGSRRASPARKSRPRPGSGSRPASDGGSSPRAVRPGPPARKAWAARAAPPPFPRWSCPMDTGAAGRNDRQRCRTSARGNRTTRRTG